MTGKSSWPELVSAPGEIAEQIIVKENPFVKAIIVEEGSAVTADFRCNRVFVFVQKKTSIVIETPRIG